jgi:predicted AlkP superfamily pyrophosphatase or phosphodiesterase
MPGFYARLRLRWWQLDLLSLAFLIVLRARAGAAPTVPLVLAPTEEPPAEAPRPHIGHVLIISEDGLRADAVAKLHLHWHDLMRKRGSYSLHAKTIRDASTLPAHASMLSGVHPNVHGLTWNNWQPHKGFIKSPTIFTRAQDAGLSTAFFTGKSKLRHIVPPGTVGVYERPGYLCKRVAEDAAVYLTTEKPALAFVHFSDPDEQGHSAGWMSKKQIRAIGDSDRCLGILYEALEKAGLLDDTLIIVSADHGGHNRVHSGAKLIDREIPWIACGPGVREDFVINDEISTVDTAATALYALGLPIPADIVGKPRAEIFIPPPPPPAPPPITLPAQ